MKNILLKLVLVASFIMLQSPNLLAQSFELIKPESKHEIIDTTNVAYEISSAPELKNISSATVNFTMTITPISLATGHYYYFCDMESCLPGPFDGVKVTPPYPLPPNVTTGSSIHIYLLPNGNDGLSVFNISFQNFSNPYDTISYFVTFNVGPLGVEENVFSMNSDVVPNPANDYVEINVNNSQTGKLIVYNISFQIIDEIQLESNIDKYILNTANYNSGNYFYKIVSDTKMKKSGMFTIVK